MPFTKRAPELFEILRKSREGGVGSDTRRADATGRTTSFARRDPTRRRRSPDDPAGWWQDADGTPIVVADDDETREVLAALGLSLVAEHRAEEEPAIGEVEDEAEVADDADEPEDAEVIENGRDGTEAHASDGEPDAAEQSKRSATPLSPVAPIQPSAADPQRKKHVARRNASLSFADRFLPPARQVPRRRPEAKAKPEPGTETERTRAFPRVAVRADTLAAGLAGALLLLALAFLGGRATARDPELAGAPGAALQPTPTESVATPPAPGAAEQLAAMAAPAVGAMAPVARSEPQPQQPEPSAAPAAEPATTPEANYHIQVVTTFPNTAAEIVDYLNEQPLIVGSGYRAYANGGVVYVGKFPKGEAKAEKLCKAIRKMDWGTKKDQFTSAYILRAKNG